MGSIYQLPRSLKFPPYIQTTLLYYTLRVLIPNLAYLQPKMSLNICITWSHAMNMEWPSDNKSSENDSYSNS